MVKTPPAMQEMQVQSLGWEDPLEKEMATHSSILAWEIPQTEEPGRLQSMGSQLDATLNNLMFRISVELILKLLFLEKFYLAPFSNSPFFIL